MSASFFSTSHTATALADGAGFDSQLLTGHEAGQASGTLPDAASFAKQILALVGLGSSLEGSAGSNASNKLIGGPAKSQDLVFVHLRPDVSEDSNGAQPSSSTAEVPSPSTSDTNLVEHAKASLLWLDALVAAVREVERRDSRVSARLFLVLVLSYHATAVRDSAKSKADSESEKSLGKGLLGFKPLQSYQQKDGEILTNIRSV